MTQEPSSPIRYTVWDARIIDTPNVPWLKGTIEVKFDPKNGQMRIVSSTPSDLKVVAGDLLEPHS